MIHLDNKIILNKDVIDSPNLCDRFSDEDLRKIGNLCWEGYNRDKTSRLDWERRTQAAMDLAMQLQKDKSFPWPNCSNIAFPLVTIATLQFHSRAYPSIIQGPDVVKCRVIGKDPQGKEHERADRISTHMSWQLMEEDKGWEEQHDRLLINLPIVGSAFTKSYFFGAERHNVSELVLAQDLIIHYYATSIEAARRKTHRIPMYRNDIYERIMNKAYRDVREEHWYNGTAPQPESAQTARKDQRTGQQPPQSDEDTPFDLLEQHRYLDLDGDGYAEPYIVTIERTSHQVLRIVTRFNREEDIDRNMRKEIISIRPTEYFTKYSFIPSPDGGIYDIGFGVPLGPLNESVNSLINQLVDGGTISNTAGGFLGRGAKIRGGVYTFAPLEWKRVDSTGDDLRKNIVPLPVREPSAVLFQLLWLLINYVDRVSGSTDLLVGENPGQNTPAETSRTMVEQGTKIYSNIFKRVWRSMKKEFKKLYLLNAVHLDTRKYFGEGDAYALREDYKGSPDNVVPVADPNIVSDAARFSQATAIKQAAMVTPGYNIEAVERKYLRAMKVDDIEVIYPGPQKVPPLPNPKMQVEQVKLEGKKMQFQSSAAQFAAKLMEERRLNNAKIANLEAQSLKLLHSIGSEDAKTQIAAFDSAIGALKSHDESLRKHIELVMQQLETADGNPAGERVSGMAAPSGNQGGMAAVGAPPGGPEGAMG
ncbi:MAG: hypothetical protein KGL39_55415 [Patescibacteria group bacterium]|nr:hypothetical protein [Patescibacteria group bacterium]